MAATLAAQQKYFFSENLFSHENLHVDMASVLVTIVTVFFDAFYLRINILTISF